jgi:hypothetical protein
MVENAKNYCSHDDDHGTKICDLIDEASIGDED